MNSASQMIPSDARLPRLADLFDVAAVGERLQREIFAVRGERVEACDVDRVKYRPQRNCVIGYRLRVRDAASNVREQRVALGMYQASDAAARYEQACALAPTSVALLADWHTLVWAFPHDRKLPSLRALTNAHWVEQIKLSELAQARWGVGKQVLLQDNTVISYFPEHTCTLREQVILNPVSECESWLVYAKTRSDDVGAATYAHMQALWQSKAAQAGAVSYARPLAYDAALRILWQEAAAGETLDSRLDRASAATLANVGSAIAALHTTALDHTRSISGDDVIAQLARAQDVLQRVGADDTGLAQRVVAALLRQTAFIDFSANATLHGDLHSNNILVAGERVTLIDFDGLARGPALAELGSFLAEMIYRACIAQTSLPMAQMEVILARYQRSVPWHMQEEQLAWFTAAALVGERAYRCVTSLKPRRMEALPRLIAVADDIARARLRLPLAKRGRAHVRRIAARAEL